jgi:hypothetical protein
VILGSRRVDTPLLRFNENMMEVSSAYTRGRWGRVIDVSTFHRHNYQLIDFSGRTRSRIKKGFLAHLKCGLLILPPTNEEVIVIGS